MENDLNYRGGTAEQVIVVMDKNLYAAKKLEALRKENDALDHAFGYRSESIRENLFKACLNYHIHAMSGKRAELLNHPDYQAVLDKYR